jgi:ADP-heptose:LPS heptosyltransferase
MSPRAKSMEVLRVLSKPKEMAEKFRWHFNEWMLRHLGLLSAVGGRLTVLDSFGAPGDTLLAATVCRILKERFPRLRINLITRWPDLVRHDPCMATLNEQEDYFTLRFWYLETVARKETKTNILLETLRKVRISEYSYRASVYLTQEEKQWAALRLSGTGGGGDGDRRPGLAFCTQSKERVKNWPERHWRELVDRLADDYSLVHVGDEREPHFRGVQRFAGMISMRESMSVLSHCQAFLGPDSFLMHVANGLDIPSVIIFGGARPAACLGYASNTNLYVPMACGPCWLHDSRGDVCPHGVACMDKVSVDEVEVAVRAMMQSAALVTMHV